MSETTVYTDFRLHASHLAETGERSPAEVAVRRDLAAAYQLCALFGWDDLVYTHISARVPGPDHHFLVNPLGLGFDEITASSLIKIDLDGNVIGDSGGYEPNAAGFVIHGAIHSTRENAGCVMHLHTEAQMALSTLPEGLLPLTQHAMRLYGRISYHDYEGIALSEGERERLIADLGDSAAMILRNHGSLTVGAERRAGLRRDVLPGEGGPQPAAGPGHRAAADHPAAGDDRADRAPVGRTCSTRASSGRPCCAGWSGRPGPPSPSDRLRRPPGSPDERLR